MSKLYNLARMTVASTGTSTITLANAATVNGVLYLSFAAAGVSNGETVSYAIADVGGSETGTGVYTSVGTTLTRSVTSSTNANAAINMTAAAQVYITPRKQDIANLTEANSFTDTTDSTSSATGSMILAGGLGVAKVITYGTKLNMTGVAGTAGSVNVGSGGVYSYASSSKYARFNTNGAAIDFLGAGAALVFNYSGDDALTLPSQNIGMFGAGTNTSSPTLTVGGNVVVGPGGPFAVGMPAYTLSVTAGSSQGATNIFEARNSSSVAKLSVTGLGNVIIGSAALATTATDGFLYLPTCAGAPTGNSTDYSGMLPFVYDTTNNKLWVNTTGTTWRGVVLT